MTTKPTPAQAETTDDESVTIDWDGIPVIIPKTIEHCDADAMEAFENSKIITAVRSVLGSVQYSTVKAKRERDQGRPVTPADLVPLMDAIAVQFGFKRSGE